MNIFDVLLRDFPFLLKGLGVAIVLLVALLVIGFLLGMAICLLKLYPRRMLHYNTFITHATTLHATARIAGKRSPSGEPWTLLLAQIR